jgi:hypothetical protein
MSKNTGIFVTGGTVNAGAMAAGTQASAVNVTQSAPRDIAEFRAQLAQVLQEIAHSADQLEDGEQASVVGQLAAREAAKEHPNKDSLTGLLGSLAASVAAVVPLASAVGALEHAVAALF